ncbi:MULTISPECIES: DUF1097 domain-containing protein [Limnospira]|uniref:DUF1097 domain-containing protein n=1 Tax=Limnospira indica PCC 8005 TaxID=376219 RepID=A0A9P1KJM6_9CYAN|nr:DUF1097 domain-containing protein [Limnospira indica]CDM97576.1 conserved hypothetical protein (membrane) [Limnospira indica PCC 8005]
MKQSEALTISIGILGAIDVFLTATVIPIPVWVTFTAWASFFIVGGGVQGFIKSVSCNVTGIIIAAISLLAIDLIGPNPLVAAICVGIGSAAMVQASKLPFTYGITPAIVWGFSQTVGTVAVTGLPLTGTLPNNPVLIAIAAMILGNIFGYLSEAWAKAMTTVPVAASSGEFPDNVRR